MQGRLTTEAQRHREEKEPPIPLEYSGTFSYP